MAWSLLRAVYISTILTLMVWFSALCSAAMLENQAINTQASDMYATPQTFQILIEFLRRNKRWSV